MKKEESKPAELENKVVPIGNESKQDSESKKPESTNENQILNAPETEEKIQPKTEEKPEEKQDDTKKERIIEAVTSKPLEETPKPAEEPTKQENQAPVTEAAVKTEQNQATTTPTSENKEELPKPIEVNSESGQSSEKEDDSWETKDDAELVQSVKEHALNNPLETSSSSLRIYSKDFLLKFKSDNTTKPAELQNLHIILPAAISKTDNSNNQQSYERGGNYKNNTKGFSNRSGGGSGGGGGKGNRKNNYNNKKVPPSP